MYTKITFYPPQYALSRLAKLTGDSFLSFIQQLPWSFIQSIVSSSADVDPLSLYRQILEALPSDYDEALNKVTCQTTAEEIIAIVRTAYGREEEQKCSTDELIRDCVRNWTSRTSDERGLASVSHKIDPTFIEESTVAAARRVDSCLDAIGVHKSQEEGSKFFERNVRKNQVVSRLFLFWKAHVAISCVSGFIGCLFPESSKTRTEKFKEQWTEGQLDDIETLEARFLASFLCHNHPVSPSGAAWRRILLNILSSHNLNGTARRMEQEQATTVPEDEDNGSKSLADFPDLEIEDGGKKSKKCSKKMRSKSKKFKKTKKRDLSYDSSDESFDDDAHVEVESEEEDLASFCGLFPKFRQIIRQQGVPEFPVFVKPLALQVTTKSDL